MNAKHLGKVRDWSESVANGDSLSKSSTSQSPKSVFVVIYSPTVEGAYAGTEYQKCKENKPRYAAFDSLLEDPSCRYIRFPSD